MPSIGSTTQRNSESILPEVPSSPRSEMFGKALRKVRSIIFCERTSKSSLMSCWVTVCARLVWARCRRMSKPTARAASTAASRARFKSGVGREVIASLKIARPVPPHPDPLHEPHPSPYPLPMRGEGTSSPPFSTQPDLGSAVQCANCSKKSLPVRGEGTRRP